MEGWMYKNELVRGMQLILNHRWSHSISSGQYTEAHLYLSNSLYIGQKVNYLTLTLVRPRYYLVCKQQVNHSLSNDIILFQFCYTHCKCPALERYRYR